eukprot:959254-Pyramimonas_sp.AAC.1
MRTRRRRRKKRKKRMERQLPNSVRHQFHRPPCVVSQPSLPILWKPRSERWREGGRTNRRTMSAAGVENECGPP